eukprot:Platyproteum_vivax@DN3546_c0_g1_i3.p1
MGNAHPLTSKLLAQHQTATGIIAAGASMQGYRNEMEDALMCLTPLIKGAASASDSDDLSYSTGVFDGHNGERVSLQLAENLVEEIEMLSGFTEEALIDMCLDLDDKIIKGELEDPLGLGSEEAGKRDSGSTAVLCLIHSVKDGGLLPPCMGKYVSRIKSKESEDEEKSSSDSLTVDEEECRDSESSHRIVTVNVGDSRAFLLTSAGRVVPLTTDHKPDVKAEHTRISDAGGFVRMGRVDGQLSLSRAFGDAMYKSCQDQSDPRKQKVIAVPEITTTYAMPGDLLCIACDGLFE